MDIYDALGAETFTGRNFRDFRVFWNFSRKFLPRHNQNSKFVKVFAREVTENSRLAKVFPSNVFSFLQFCVAVLLSPGSFDSVPIKPCTLSL